MFGQNKSKKPVMQKQIPTILGLIILIAGLVAGLLFFGEGTGVFAPRATPQTTPKNIRVTNVKENSFTVSFYTDEATSGFVKYGKEAGKLNSQASDDRDQLSGTVSDYRLHHITIRGLESNSTYYYVLGTGSKAEFDNEGQPFSIKTANKSGSSPPALTVYGSVSNEGGTPAENSIVYISASDMGEMSSLVKSSGSWAVPLSQARNKDGSDYVNLTDQDQINILVQGVQPTQRIQFQTTVQEAQPVQELTFGQDPSNSIATDTTPSPGPEPDLANQEPPEATDSAEESIAQSEEDDTATISGQLEDMLEDAEPLPQASSASAELLIGDLREASQSSEIVYTTQTPKIKGKAKPNVEVKIEVHSENQYEETVTADENGEFELDLEALKATLEPGEHSVTYSYVDPDTGEEVVKTETFMVEDPNNTTIAMADTDTEEEASFNDDTAEDDDELLAQATTDDTDIPYGSGDPYPMTTPSPTVTSSPGSPELTPTTTQSTSSTTAGRQQPVGTDSTLAEAGSIEATMLLALAGIFLVIIGSWSWWLASELEES